MTETREILDVPLRPIAGSRFQPTGFPDLGAATFDKPHLNPDTGEISWVSALLVESAQSVGNHLEATGWDRGVQEPVPSVAGLPYVAVCDEDGTYLTSSRTEPHRLSSAFVREAELDGVPMRAVLRERLGLQEDRPLAPREIARALFALDPFCLIHGLFLSDKELPGQPKVARAVTGFVEAEDVRAAHSGGVKFDDVRHKNVEGGGSTEGYGTIPFHRTEYAAARIVASFVLDLAQIRAYGLDVVATDLLADLARWEIRTLLDGGLRLRTACDLEPLDGNVRLRNGSPLPSMDELDQRVRTGIDAVEPLLDRREPWVVTWKPTKGR
ncbi:MAG: type I-G CRISPR-associated RAMP protein Csb1/Cas7g [Egibacteraceae bacterium]